VAALPAKVRRMALKSRLRLRHDFEGTESQRCGSEFMHRAGLRTSCDAGTTSQPSFLMMIR
jgi:hypothetical protein